VNRCLYNKEKQENELENRREELRDSLLKFLNINIGCKSRCKGFSDNNRGEQEGD
jgi:hypothetical protein